MNTSASPSNRLLANSTERSVDAHEFFELVLRAQKAARRERYEFVVPSESRRVWREQEVMGNVRDVFAMGERVLIDIETPHSLIDLNGAELVRRNPGSRQQELEAVSIRTALQGGLIVWPRQRSHNTSWSVDMGSRSGAVPVENTTTLRATGVVEASAQAVIGPTRFPRWTIGTIMAVPAILLLLLVLTFNGPIPWALTTAVAVMLVSLLTTALLQLRWIARRSQARAL